MTLLEESNNIRNLLLENINNFGKDSFVLAYGKENNLELELELELNNWVGARYSGSKAFQKAMSMSINDYNESKRSAKLSSTTYLHIAITANFCKHLDDMIEAINILFNEIGNKVDIYFLFIHINNNNSVDIDMRGFINYCDCKFHYF